MTMGEWHTQNVEAGETCMPRISVLPSFVVVVVDKDDDDHHCHHDFWKS